MNSILPKLRNDNITTLMCGCDPVFLNFLTTAMNSQNFLPEMTIAGVALVDTDLVGQLMHQRVWANAFGISYAGATQRQGTSIAYRAYKSIRPDEPSIMVDIIYSQLYMLAIGIQMAGPNLTPASFEKGMFDYPRKSGPYGTWGFGPNDYSTSDGAGRSSGTPGSLTDEQRRGCLSGSQRWQTLPDRQVARWSAPSSRPVSTTEVLHPDNPPQQDPEPQPDARQSTMRRLLESTPIRFGMVAGLAVALWPILAVVLPKGMPPGVVLLGLVFGATTGLTSAGLILIWRANRVINFANLAIAGVAGSAAVRSFLQWDIPYWAALLLAPFIGLAVGALVEVAVIRRFANAPRLVLTVATIGLAQLLGGIELAMMERLFGDVPQIVAPFETPLSSVTVTLGPVILDGNDLLPLAVVPVIVGALAWFMQRSLAGQGIRAAAENTERARLLGIPVRRLTTLVWALAGLLAAATLVLRAPSLGMAPSVTLGPTLLLPALAAAIVARMESMPVAFGAAMLIGVIEQTLRWNTDTPSLLSVMMLVIILLALLAQRRGASRAYESDGAWRDTELISKLHPSVTAMGIVKASSWRSR
ncbi:MAG: branched-chain amino acid ABC transporter permease [Microthrixaceae bacterium]|nr:branched-chain amino acid ABC transporter permease [Microthrixaceae bacterium]